MVNFTFKLFCVIKIFVHLFHIKYLLKKMKKLNTLFLFTALALCGNAQVKKVVLEDFTGTWCGWCPEGTVVLENLKAQHGANFFPVASHNGDPLEIPEGAAIDVGLNVTAYPNGSVDRFMFTGTTKIPMSRGSWASKTTERLNSSSIASVSFGNAYKKTIGTVDSFYVDLNVKFTAAAKVGVPVAVNVYILEDSIAATGNLAQGNYSSNVQGGADPLTNWFHNHTLRDALLNAWGDNTVIPTNPTVGTTYTKKIGFVIPAAWKKNQIHLLGYAAYAGTASANTLEIINSDGASLKNFWPLGLNPENALSASGVNIYPNPVRANTTFSINYNLLQDDNITVSIINSLGQVVATPYSDIFDIKGIHTLQINTANYALPSGLYFVKMSSENGSSLSRFTVQ
jgi:thiol-disulfide isomerase/thioredoxin